jgi:hypothetical protein
MTVFLSMTFPGTFDRDIVENMIIQCMFLRHNWLTDIFALSSIFLFWNETDVQSFFLDLPLCPILVFPESSIFLFWHCKFDCGNISVRIGRTLRCEVLSSCCS